MSYQLYIPGPLLQPYVRSFAISQNSTAATYKVLPGMGIVMGFQYSGRLSYLQGNAELPLSSAGMTGLMDAYRLFQNTANTSTLLVTFSETGAAAFFKTPMHELFNQSLSLDDLLLRSQMDVVLEQLHSAASNEARIKVVEKFLLSRLDHQAADELVNMAVTIIQKHHGLIKIAELAQQLHISQGQLEKRFRKLVGASPKKFASLARLRHVLGGFAKQITSLDVGLDAGYFDQAHFIKDFRAFTGQTPQQFLNDL